LRPEIIDRRMPTTLIAVTGLSPAIVTETLYALAHATPPQRPNRVVLITTVTGAIAIEEQLFKPCDDWGGLCVWETFRRQHHAGPDEWIAEEPQIICMTDSDKGRSQAIDDIRTPAENAAASEFIFSKVWDVVRDPEQTLIASIAGGRKTMGALLHSAVSLIGRESDLVTHVLVNEPYDTLPGFFYPDQPNTPLIHRNGGAYAASDASLMLAEVPFVPLRNRFCDLDELPPSFERLRRSLSHRLRRDADRPIPIVISHCQEYLEVDGVRYTMRARALAILHFILLCQEKGQTLTDQTTAADAMSAWLEKHPEIAPKLSGREMASSDFQRELNHLRTILANASWMPASRTLIQRPFTLELQS